MDQINNDPDLIAQLDANDQNPGDGVWDITGCPESWTCDNIIDSQIAFYDWENIDQVTDPDPEADGEAQADYDAMFDRFLEQLESGLPAATFTWIPSGYVTRAVPGEDVLWLSIHPDSVLDSSNPLGIEGGENFDQHAGFGALGTSSCIQPCQLGFEAADLQVTANREFLDADPFLAALLPLIAPDAFELQLLVVEQFRGDGSERHVEELAARWVRENQDLVDSWTDSALATIG